MEYDTVKQKEKKISVKICRGSIWEELKENLTDKKCYDDKKIDKKKLVVDVNVKREFRSNLKDEGWMNRIKSVLGRSKEETPPDKKESAAKQPNKTEKKETNKGKPCDKKKEGNKRQEPDKIDNDIIEESLNLLGQNKKRSKDKESTSGAQKSKKMMRLTQEEDLKDKTKSKEHHKSLGAGGDMSKDKERATLEDGLKSSRPKGNKYEVQINNKVTVMNPSDSEEDAVEALERANRRQITKDKRSKSKPATAKEKWNEALQGKRLEASNEPTLESINNLKSSIISLRLVDKKVKKKDAEKSKEHKNKREEEKKKKKKVEEEVKSSTNEQEKQPNQTSTETKEATSEKKKKQGHDATAKQTEDSILEKVDKAPEKENPSAKEIAIDKKADKSSTDIKKKKEKKDKAKVDSSPSCLDNAPVEETKPTKVEPPKSPREPPPEPAENIALDSVKRSAEEMSESAKNPADEAVVDDTLPLYSSSCYSGSSWDEQECSCGCMESSNNQICHDKSDSSASTSSSVEYLRSYSGNLIMCAHGKKPVLSERIRYLSSCLKL